VVILSFVRVLARKISLLDSTLLLEVIQHILLEPISVQVQPSVGHILPHSLHLQYSL
jgi:hypothetical protein